MDQICFGFRGGLDPTRSPLFYGTGGRAAGDGCFDDKVRPKVMVGHGSLGAREATMAVIFNAASEANEVLQDVDLSGWRVLVTGVSTGIGLETVRVLTDRGALVVGTARDVGKAHAALTQVCMDAGSSGGFEIIKLDLASLASVRACADILLEKTRGLALSSTTLV